MGWTDQIRANAAAIQMILDKGVNIAQLPTISTTVQPGDMMAMKILSTGETVKVTYGDIVSAFSASAVQFYATLGSFPVTGFTNKLYVSLADNLMYIWDNGAYEIAGGGAVHEHNHDDLYQPLDADLTSIAGLTGTTGFLKKTALDTWTLDTTTYLVTETDPIFTAWDKSTGISITSDQVTDFHTAVTNNSAVLLNTAKISATGLELESTDIDTLTKLNAIMTTADLIDTNDPRLSDARTPLAHTHQISEVVGLQTALDGKVDDAQVLTNVPAGALFTDTIYTLPFADNSANWNTAYSWGNHAGLYEPLLGNPLVDGYVLSSTIAGVRSWIPAGAGSQNLRQVLDVGNTAESPDTQSWITLDIDNNPYIGWNLYSGGVYSLFDVSPTYIAFGIFNGTGVGSRLNLVPASNYIETVGAGGLSTKFDFEQPTSTGIRIKFKHPVGASASTVYYAPLSVNGVFADSNASITIPVGTGDMLKSIYDTTGNNIVDNAEKVNGLTVLTAVPAGALFTDTIYDDTALQLIVASKLSSADINTLAELNAIITDTDLIATTDPRLSDARTPLAHTHIISEVTGLQTALDGKVDDAQVLTNVPAGALFTDTWLPNTQAQNGYVTAGGTNFNKAWATDGTGVPAWRDISTTAVPGATAKHTQAVANVTWNFSHGLGEPYPVITVWNDLGKVVIPQDIARVNDDNLTITFNVAVAGVATAVVGGAGATGTTGNGIDTILRTSGDGSPGTTDTYTITYTDLTTDTFTVYNGADGAGGASPLTTKGDLFTFSTVGTRLPVGTNGYILSANSATATGLEWIVAPTGGGSTNLSYTASPTNGIVVSDTGTDATIPLGTGTNAGLLAPAQFTILSNTSGTNSGDNAANTTSNTYADGKVAQTITNGVTTSAPSQDAVFDALALKSDTGHTHSAYSRATSVLANAVVFSDIIVSSGIVTGISTRTLTLANLGYTGATDANNYVHPTTDGSLHVPATGTTNSGKVLTAGATAGVFTWEIPSTGTTDHTLLSNIGTNTHTQIDTALTRLANTSGTNTGDNAVNTLYSGLVTNATHTGDVTGATVLTIGANKVLTSHILDANVTLAKMANVATATVFYRKTASTGVPEVQTLATLKTDLGLTGTNSGDNAVNTLYSGLVTNATHTGEVTGATALTITDGAVTLAKMANMATASLIYRKTAGAGVPEVNSLATLKTDLGLTGTNSGDQTSGTVSIDDHSATPTTAKIVGIVYGTSATPPTASTTPIGTLYIQYTA